MKIEEIDGLFKGKIFLYALSTCVWCQKTKQFLNELGVKYSYVDVDLLEEGEKSSVKAEIMSLTGRNIFPTILINDKDYIVGYKESEIKAALDL